MDLYIISFISVFLFSEVFSAQGTPVSYSTYSCPNGIHSNNVHLVFEKTCYEFVVNKRNYWTGARHDCNNKGGDLALVTNGNIQYFLHTTLLDLHIGNHAVWIGLHDRNREGHFEWVDGSALSYSHWASHQGRGILHLTQDCVQIHMGDHGLWHDRECHLWPNKFSYICQYPAIETVHTVKPQILTTSTSPLTSTTSVAIKTTEGVANTKSIQATTTSIPATTKPSTSPSTTLQDREFPKTTTLLPDREIPSTIQPNREYPKTTLLPDREIPSTIQPNREYPKTTLLPDWEIPSTIQPNREYPKTTLLPDREIPSTIQPNREYPKTTLLPDWEIPSTIQPNREYPKTEAVLIENGITSSKKTESINLKYLSTNSQQGHYLTPNLDAPETQET